MRKGLMRICSKTMRPLDGRINITLKRRALAMLLAVAMLASVFTVHVFSAVNHDDAIHFIIRHWHVTSDPDFETTTGDGELEEGASNVTTNDFVVIEGYMSANEVDLYWYVKDGDPLTPISLADAIKKGYVTSFSGGVLTLPAKPVEDEASGLTLERFSGFSISSGQTAVTVNSDNIKITYMNSVRLVKAHVFYMDALRVPGAQGVWSNPEQDTMTVSGKKVYNTNEGLHTDKTASIHYDYDDSGNATTDERTFDLDLEAWYSGGTPANVGLVLDASGSMAFTSENPKAVKVEDAMKALGYNDTQIKNLIRNRQVSGKVSGTGWNSKFLTTAEVNMILDIRKTDDSPLSEAAYSYYVYDARPDTREFVPLGYITSFTNNVPYGKARNVIGSMDTSTYSTPGWYYVNHTSNWTSGYIDPTYESGKSYIGNRYSGYNYTDSIDAAHNNFPSGFKDGETPPGGGTGSVWTGSSDLGPIKFYIDNAGYLRTFFATGTQNNGERFVCSYVYESEDKSYIKLEALQRALGSFTTSLLERSPSSQVGAVRFSTERIYTNRNNTYVDFPQLVALDWTSNAIDSAGMLSLKYGEGKTINGSAPLHPLVTPALTQYNYGMTGGTNTWTGLKSYVDNLMPREDRTKNKYLIVFTDGKDSNYPAGTDATKQGYVTNAINYANTLKNDGYTIFAVMLPGGPCSPGNSDYDNAKEFLYSLIGTNDQTKSRDPKDYFFSTAELTDDDEDGEGGSTGTAGQGNTVDKLVKIFSEEILGRILDDMDEYRIQDYIDPRFDLVSASGRQWHLNANGKIEITNTDGSIYGTYDLKTGTAESTHSNPKIETDVDGQKYLTITLSNGAEIDEDAHAARLFYDEAADMYFIRWVNQTIPGSTTDADELPIWHGRITVRAKDDFLGGNAVLSNGNAAGQNYVYRRTDGNKSSGTGDAKAKHNAAGEITDYPSKGFPRTTLNVKSPSSSNDNGNRIYMGENITWDEFYNLFKEWIDNTSVNLYWDYLERYAKYEAEKNGTTLDKELSELLMAIMQAGQENKDYTIPYYYLPDDEDGETTNQTGGEYHRGDKIGDIIYTWESPFMYDPDNNIFGLQTDTESKTTKISARYEPLSYDDRTSDEALTYTDEDGKEKTRSYNEALVAQTGETDYKWNSEYKETQGDEFDDDDIEDSNSQYQVDIVAGEIALQMVIKDEAKSVISSKLESGSEIVYSADLWREYVSEELDADGKVIKQETVKVKIGTYTATYVVGETGEYTVEAELKIIEDSNYDYATYGLPLGTYTLETNSDTTTGTAYLGFIKTITPVTITDENKDLFVGNALNTTSKTPESDGYNGTTYEENADKYPAKTGAGTAYLGGSDKSDPNKAYLNELYALFEVYLVPVDPGEVTIEKQIVRDPTDPEFNKEKDEFEFSIELNESGINTIFDIREVEFAFTPANDQNGNPRAVSWSAADLVTGTVTGTFKLNHGQSVTISGIPSGVTYKITETRKGKYDLEGIKKDGTDYSGNVAEGTISTSATSWEFDNAPPKESGVIEVKKVVDKTGIPTDMLFSFMITFTLPNGFDIKDVKDANGNTIASDATDIGNKTYTYRFSLADGGTFRLKVPVGTTYKIEETNSHDYTLTGVAGDGEVNNNVASGIIEIKNEEDKWTFTNFKEKEYGKLEVKKVVDETSVPTKESFPFSITLKLPRGYDISEVKDAAGNSITGYTQNSNGTYTVTFNLAHGETFTLSQVPVGTEYTITETDSKGYTVTGVTKNGGSAAVNNNEVSDTVAANNVTYSWIFNNHKDKEFGSIKVNKLVRGTQTAAAFPFKITLELPEGYDISDVKDANGTSIAEDTEHLTDNGDGTYTYTFELAHGETFTLSEVPVGTEYTIEETNSSGYTLTVDGSESSIVTGTVEQKEETYSWTFNNTKEGSIEVRKLVAAANEAGSEYKGEEFEFTVTLTPPEGTTLDFSRITAAKYGDDGVAVTGFSIAWVGPNTDGTYTGTFGLKHNERVALYNLPVGTVYTVAETSAVGDYILRGVASYKTDEDGKTVNDANGIVSAGTVEQDIASGEVDQDTTHHWDFTNGLPSKAGSLEISKALRGDKADLGKEFEFTIILTSPEGAAIDLSEFEYTLSPDEGAELEGIGWETIADGVYKGTIKLKGGHTLKIANIPMGTSYTIEETDPNGYELVGVESSRENEDGEVLDGAASETESYDPATGRWTASGTIEEETTHKWEFTNRPPFEFPSTGGMGVAHSVIFGALLLAASLVLRKKHVLVD